MAASNYGPHSYDSLRKAMNKTTASERERFEAWALNIGWPYSALIRAHYGSYANDVIHHHWLGWQARAALPAPADQPPSQEPQGSSGSLSESGVEARTQAAASALDLLPARTVLRIKKECAALGLDIVAFAWRIQGAARHQCDALLDQAQTEAYAEGRKDEREDLQRLLAWAYRKLLPYSFATQEDALTMDEIKLILEQGQ